LADTDYPKTKYFAVFDVGDKESIDLLVDWRALGLSGKCVLRDLWTHKDLGVIDGGYNFHLGPHASGLYKVSAAKSGGRTVSDH
jgi:hypothetical protein